MTDTRDITQEERDAAQRMADAVNMHVTVATTTHERITGYVAINLEDGRAVTSDLYESRKDAVKHNGGNRGVFYVKVGASSMPLREAIIVLQMARMAYRNGVVFAEEEPLAPQLSELLLPMMPRTMNGVGFSNRAARRHPQTPSGLHIPTQRRTR